MKGGIREGGGSVRNAILPWVLLGYIVGNWWHWNMNVYDQYYVYSPSTLSFYSALMNGCLVMAGINFFLCRYTHPGSVPNSSEWVKKKITVFDLENNFHYYSSRDVSKFKIKNSNLLECRNYRYL